MASATLASDRDRNPAPLSSHLSPASTSDAKPVSQFEPEPTSNWDAKQPLNLKPVDANAETILPETGSAITQSRAANASPHGGEETQKERQKPNFRPLPSLEGWRGLAHYRTESRRKVVMKKPEERTASDLYVLEESVKNVKLISELPLAKRLEVCKYLGHEVLDENQHVYEQGSMGSTFYIVFTGVVRASVCEEGVQEPKTKVMLPGDCFGELALLSDNLVMVDTAFTTERCELLTLTRTDYENILKIEKTPEMKARVKFLKDIEAFQNVTKQSLQRLAHVLSCRTYSKNKVITLQGDEASEMFFVKSGECRIIMEVTSVRKPVLRLPRVSTFLYMDSPTTHQKCKLEVLRRELDYGRPSLISRASRRSSSRLDIPSGLPDVLLETSDLIHELALGHTRAQKAARVQKSRPSESRTLSRLGNARSKSKSQRPFTAPLSFKDSAPLSPWSSAKGPRDNGAQVTDYKKLSRQPRVPFSSTTPKSRAVAKEDKGTSRPSSRQSSPSGQGDAQGSTKSAAAATTTAGDKEEQPVIRRPKRRRSSFAQKYTLDAFLSEIEAKQRVIRDMDFSERDHALWHMGMSQGAVKSGFSEDVKYYKYKFQKWAREVLERERRLFGFNIYDDQQYSPSFTKGAPLEHIMRLEQGTGPQSQNRKTEKDTMILDIGALQAGTYFGEKGLLEKSRRAVSIVTICPVEVLVLNVWDFHRNCDRDIIAALAAHDYKKEEEVYKQYLKNCRWEQFKKKCLDEIVERQNYDRCLRVGARGVRYIPKGNASNPFAPPPVQWK